MIVVELSVSACLYRWVHLVCALYVPGVAFSNVDKLNGVTLFEMPYTKWGAKVCPVSSKYYVCITYMLCMYYYICTVYYACIHTDNGNW